MLLKRWLISWGGLAPGFLDSYYRVDSTFGMFEGIPFLTYRENKNPFQRDGWTPPTAGHVLFSDVGMAAGPTDRKLGVFE